MVIDFHTHIFPEKIAAKTIAALETCGGIKAATNGTLSGLKRSMKLRRIAYTVAFPVVIKPSHFEIVNPYTASTKFVFTSC